MQREENPKGKTSLSPGANGQQKRLDYAAPRLKRHGDLEKITQTSLARMFFYSGGGV